MKEGRLKTKTALSFHRSQNTPGFGAEPQELITRRESGPFSLPYRIKQGPPRTVPNNILSTDSRF